MSMQSNCPPVLLIVFNRPDLTKRVLNELSLIQPKQLFVSGDGPRPEVVTDRAACDAVRQLFTELPWRCELRTRFENENIGCRMAVTNSITWFFQSVEQGIILEDDCLPDPTFFPFCRELLIKYQDEDCIKSISGTNLIAGLQAKPTKSLLSGSYTFSRLQQVWGWATWRRAWKQLRDDQLCLDHLKLQSVIADELGGKAFATWTNQMQATLRGEIDTWDYLWLMSCWYSNGYTIIPSRNLVCNIGFDDRATHTRDSTSKGSLLVKQAIEFPLRHPSQICIESYDTDVMESFHNIKPEKAGLRRHFVNVLQRLRIVRDRFRLRAKRENKP